VAQVRALLVGLQVQMLVLVLRLPQPMQPWLLDMGS
jgi:hypothetical protein